MYKAALVEDEQEIRSFLSKTLTEQFQKQGVSVAIDSFSSGERFLTVFQEHYHYDMIFLDIEMEGMDGIEVCRQIRAMTHNALVVFISNKESLVFQTFEVQPFRFIRKSHYLEALPRLVDALTEQLNSLAPDLIQICEPFTGDIYSFDASQLRYVEAQRKYCRIVAADSEVMVQCPFKTLEELLLPRQFVKTHRSYLVNLRHIFRIGKTFLTLTDQTEIPVSRSQMDTVRQQLLRFTMK